MFKRKAYDELLRWKEESKGDYAMLIEGARRVGKTTLVLNFAEKEYDSYIYIDFSFRPKPIIELFEEYAGDLNLFFVMLQQRARTVLHKRRSVIIFDEVQHYPFARQMIKHFVADGRYDFIETGSLISIRQNVASIQIPSEELSITLHPLDFEEFLWAMGDTYSISVLKQYFDSRHPLGFEMHKFYMKLYRLYMLVGGMPQSVAAFLENKNFKSVENAKKSVLKLYSEDVSKIVTGGGSTANAIFRMVPALLSSHEKTFKPSRLIKGARTRDYMSTVTWLEESKIINVCRRSSNPDVAMELTLDEHSFKMYMLDTGLLITASLAYGVGEEDEIYDSLLNDRLNINEGMFFENMVAQELVASGRRLYFSKFYIKESKNPQEVDFVLVCKGKLVPVECKSGSISTRHKSLDRFKERHSKKISTSYVVHDKDLRVDGDTVYIPIYMSMFL